MRQPAHHNPRRRMVAGTGRSADVSVHARIDQPLRLHRAKRDRLALTQSEGMLSPSAEAPPAQLPNARNNR
jgi:hypothetical protein